MTRKLCTLALALLAALTLNVGTSWGDDPPADAIPAGERAAPGTVGFLGNPALLDVINSQATANLYAPGSSWSNGVLTVNQATLTLFGVYVKGVIDYYGTGRLTVKQSIVESAGQGQSVIYLRNPGGEALIQDSDIIWPTTAANPGTGWGNACIHGDAKPAVIVRNEISGCPDGIQQFGGNVSYRQNYIHGLAGLGTYPNNTHNDGIQLYGGPDEVISGNYIELNGYDGTHQNAAIFLSDDGPDHVAPTVKNNYISGGGIPLRVESGQDGIYKGNDFGCLCGGFYFLGFEPGVTTAIWQNNRAPDGSLFPDPA